MVRSRIIPRRVVCFIQRLFCRSMHQKIMQAGRHYGMQLNLYLKTENPFERKYVSAKGESMSRYHLFHLLRGGESLPGHDHAPSAVTGGPVAPTPAHTAHRCSRRGSRKEFNRDSWLSSHRRQLSGHEGSDLLVSGHRRFSPIIMDCHEFVKGFTEIFSANLR